MDREEIAKEQADFEELAKDSYSVERLKRAPSYYQDSHTEAAFHGWLMCREFLLRAPPSQDVAQQTKDEEEMGGKGR